MVISIPRFSSPWEAIAVRCFAADDGALDSYINPATAASSDALAPAATRPALDQLLETATEAAAVRLAAGGTGMDTPGAPFTATNDMLCVEATRFCLGVSI